MEKEEESFDHEFISKYIREDSNDAAVNSFKQKFETKQSGSIEVLGSVGEGENQVGNNNFNRRRNEENAGPELHREKSKFTSSPASKAKQEFLKHLEDDSLTVDTCNRVNHDWKK